MNPPAHPGPGASEQARKVYLCEQLDALAGHKVLGTLTVLGGFQHRFTGGARLAAACVFVIYEGLLVMILYNAMFLRPNRVGCLESDS